MGWEEFLGHTQCPKCHCWYPTSEYRHWVRADTKQYAADGGWNPLTSWRCWRDIEERLMEDGKGQLIKAYMKSFDGKFDYLGSTLEERVTFLLSALDSLNSK